MKDEIILSQEEKETLESLCEDYNVACEEATSYDNKKKALNGYIKQTMADYGIDKFVSSTGLSLSISTRPNVSWNEDALTVFCETLNHPDLVKTTKYVDFDVLEALIYNGIVKPEDLKPFRQEKPDIVTLKCTQKKILKE